MKRGRLGGAAAALGVLVGGAARTAVDALWAQPVLAANVRLSVAQVTIERGRGPALQSPTT